MSIAEHNHATTPVVVAPQEGAGEALAPLDTALLAEKNRVLRGYTPTVQEFDGLAAEDARIAIYDDSAVDVPSGNLLDPLVANEFGTHTDPAFRVLTAECKANRERVAAFDLLTPLTEVFARASSDEIAHLVIQNPNISDAELALGVAGNAQRDLALDEVSRSRGWDETYVADTQEMVVVQPSAQSVEVLSIVAAVEEATIVELPSSPGPVQSWFETEAEPVVMPIDTLDVDSFEGRLLAARRVSQTRQVGSIYGDGQDPEHGFFVQDDEVDTGAATPILPQTESSYNTVELTSFAKGQIWRDTLGLHGKTFQQAAADLRRWSKERVGHIAGKWANTDPRVKTAVYAALGSTAVLSSVLGLVSALDHHDAVMSVATGGHGHGAGLADHMPAQSDFKATPSSHDAPATQEFFSPPAPQSQETIPTPELSASPLPIDHTEALGRHAAGTVSEVTRDYYREIGFHFPEGHVRSVVNDLSQHISDFNGFTGHEHQLTAGTNVNFPPRHVLEAWLAEATKKTSS